MKTSHLLSWQGLLAVVGSLSLTVSQASAQGAYEDTPGMPDAPWASRVTELVKAYNAGTPEAIEKAVTDNFTGPFLGMPMQQHIAVWKGSLRETGPIEYLAHRTYDPPRDDEVLIFRSEVTGGYFAMVLEDEGKAPHRFTSLRFSPARTPSYLEPGEGLRGAALVDAVDGLIDRLAERDMFSGTIVIAKDGQRIYERSAGVATRRFDVPNRLDTKFNLGSMNKMFTAVAIAALVEDGKLDFNDLVGAHLPDYPNQEVREKVRIKHLLCHTSGMGSHFNQKFMEGSKFLYRDVDDYLDIFGEQELAFEPGTEWAYSNAGFYVLGMIIEAASGQSYYDYVREHVYAPAGMVDSDSYDMDIPIKNLAIGYTTDGMGFDLADDGARWLEESPWRNNYFMHSIKGGPAGGGFSTSPDLIAFATALRRNMLLSPASFETLTTAKPELSSPDYGFGFGVQDDPKLGRIVGHSGGFPGINAQLDIYLDLGYDVAVMANMSGAASLVAHRVNEFLAGMP